MTDFHKECSLARLIDDESNIETTIRIIRHKSEFFASGDGEFYRSICIHDEFQTKQMIAYMLKTQRKLLGEIETLARELGEVAEKEAAENERCL
jgi:hypothetical protein